jgi:uncharacterized protein with PIN domain
MYGMAKKKTHEEFIKEVFDLVEEEYTILGEYINSKTNIEFIHNVCNHKFNMKPNHFLSGQRCPKCKKHIPYTLETLKEKICGMVGNEYDIWGEYKNNKSKINIRHNICGYEWFTSANGFLRGNRCPKCSKKLHKNTLMFTKEVYDLVGSEYEVLGEYESTHKNILMRHNKCGLEWNVEPNHFLHSGSRCPKCAGVFPYTTKTFKEKVFELVRDEYSVLGEYINSSTKVLIEHNNCKYNWNVEPNNFLSGSRCPNCYGNIRKTTEQFKKEVYGLVQDEYSVLGEYINSQTKLLMKHNKCDHEWYIVPDSFLCGKRCPVCASSKGEKRVRKYLKYNNIIFEEQYKFTDCKGIKRVLPFDFAIFNNGKLLFLIEYQGKHHYESIKRFGGEENFKKTKYNDNIKYNYCLLNNIPLIYIPYWEFNNIEDILDNYLDDLNIRGA